MTLNDKTWRSDGNGEPSLHAIMTGPSDAEEIGCGNQCCVSPTHFSQGRLVVDLL